MTDKTKRFLVYVLLVATAAFAFRVHDQDLDRLKATQKGLKETQLEGTYGSCVKFEKLFDSVLSTADSRSPQRKSAMEALRDKRTDADVRERARLTIDNLDARVAEFKRLFAPVQSSECVPPEG
jgi:hypothetical protein